MRANESYTRYSRGRLLEVGERNNEVQSVEGNGMH